MNLFFISEIRFEMCKDGHVYSPDGGFNKKLINRYLLHFSKISIIARVKNSDEFAYSSESLDENNKVEFVNLPYYIGLSGFLKNATLITKIIQKHCNPGNAYLLRIPGPLGFIMALELHKRRIPYGIEVVGDPWDVFARKSIKHPLRAIIRLVSTIMLKNTVINSSAALYVTKEKLQRRYPVHKNVFQCGISDVNLDEVAIAKKEKMIEYKPCYSIISIGSLEQMYKSPDIAIESIKLLNDRGLNCILTWLGDGKFKNKMIEYSKLLNIEDKCHFVGSISPSCNVRTYIDSADLFILVSRTEGLPRALIESMARGIPCIGTKVGGIPELLEETALIIPNNALALADKILYFIKNKEFTIHQASRNLKESKNYSENVLQSRREAFYKEIIRITKHESSSIG